MRRRLVCIVEGHGEVDAVPNLCARILNHLERWSWSVDQRPIKQPRSWLVDERSPGPRRVCHEERLAAAVELAKSRPAEAILVLCDADNDCPPEWNRTAIELSAARKWPPVAAVMAVREYESWLLANETESALRSVDVADPEKVRGAKEKLAALHPRYLPTTHQLELTRKIDIGRLRRRSRSFDKLVRSISSICAPG